MKKQLCLFSLSWLFLAAVPAFSQTITVNQLSQAPQIDGSAADWQAYPANDITLEGDLDIKNVSVKCGTNGDEVFFLFQWKDDSHDMEHKPYIWDAGEGKYIPGNQMEDRLAINFGMEGDFTHDWFSGNAFKADMWHWKAARSNPLGLAQDKQTIITTEETRKAYKAVAKNGKDIYIMRPSDAGDSFYSTKRYAVKEKDVMPKYVLNEDPQGSVADVKAKGVWENGQWTLEMKRKLNTGNSDDKVFNTGEEVLAAIAVFNHSGDDKHNISDTLTLQF